MTTSLNPLTHPVLQALAEAHATVTVIRKNGENEFTLQLTGLLSYDGQYCVNGHDTCFKFDATLIANVLIGLSYQSTTLRIILQPTK